MIGESSLNVPSTLNALLLFILTAFAFAVAAADSNIIKTLPGYPGTLPFKLETGYISLGENGERQLFYYFVESERDPNRDPLLFWITGGLGCSGLSALVYEIGPLAFDFSTFNGSLPDLVLSPYSWTKIASIIFIDAPVGTGFSYINTSQVYTSSDTKSTSDYHLFLRKWLLNHRSFIKNRLYVGGDSYGGKVVPMVALEIIKGNEAGFQPKIALNGYLTGNSPIDAEQHINERIRYAHRMALISDEYYERAKSSCNGDYLNVDPNNYECLHVLQLIEECTNEINDEHILVPKCTLPPPKSDDFTERRMIIENDPIDVLLMSKQEDTYWCLVKSSLNNHVTSYAWANDPSVQEALYVRKGMIKDDWKICNESLLYEDDVENVVAHHQLLLHKGYEALVYSGDRDMVVPYTSTVKWTRSLNITTEDEWRPWTVDGQVAGYTEKYKKNDKASLTFATVKARKIHDLLSYSSVIHAGTMFRHGEEMVVFVPTVEKST
ncbi:serine carboxypeptidase [Dorcoceras hygrometricum]|uniref:Serine carboxypeptidase n=1 Tax=Dorcoceras hygrometricum TaxID=472368 RepID=A0A2Z7BTT3_9LAMI|nr:serine carboxypeptidase [Dorcoceras hygrometricum]